MANNKTMSLPNLAFNEQLANHTTFRLGGPAKYFVVTKNQQEIITAVQVAKAAKIKYCILAGGSNSIFSDKGFSGLVIKIKSIGKNGFKQNGQFLEIAAGVPLAEAVVLSAKRGLSGLEYLAAIPGSIGGAIVGNAGAFEHFIGDLVNWVEIFDGRRVKKLRAQDCHFSYRDSIFKKKPWIVLRARLKLKKNNRTDLEKIIRPIIRARRQKYQGLLCAGSFFKNVPVRRVAKTTLKKIDPIKISNGKIPVGYLLEQAGGQSQRVGGISVASFHSNFLINNGFGTFRDLDRLAEKLKSLVKKKFGIVLEREVRYIL